MGEFTQITSAQDLIPFQGCWVAYKTTIDTFKPYPKHTNEHKDHTLKHTCYAQISASANKWLFRPPSYRDRCHTMDPLLHPKASYASFCLTDTALASGGLYMRKANLNDMRIIMHMIDMDNWKVNNSIANGSRKMIIDYMKMKEWM
jgi:hypothetical protein